MNTFNPDRTWDLSSFPVTEKNIQYPIILVPIGMIDRTVAELERIREMQAVFAKIGMVMEMIEVAEAGLHSDMPFAEERMSSPLAEYPEAAKRKVL